MTSFQGFQMLQMSASNVLFHLALLTVAVIVSGRGCPEPCICTDENNLHLAKCTYEDLTEVPSDLPRNVTILNLSYNRITFITLGRFDRVAAVASLWIAHNNIASIQEGSLAPLAHLRNFDISHNKLMDFPWQDLLHLTALQMLKMNDNDLVLLPRDAFANLKNLKSLVLNNNKFLTVAHGTFDGLTSVSHVQLYNNPFTCDCLIDWLREWVLTTKVAVPEQDLIICHHPPDFEGLALVRLPPSKCTGPNVTITAELNADDRNLKEDTSLILTCEASGNPNPAITWRIRSKIRRETVVMTPEDEGSTEETEESSFDAGPLKVFSNGTLVILNISPNVSGNYSCTATNEFGSAEDVVAIEVVTSHTPIPARKGFHTNISTKALPSPHQLVTLTSVWEPSPPSPPPPPDTNADNRKSTQPNSAHASKCVLSSRTKFVSNHAFNGSLGDVKEFTFDFGIMALRVSKTEADVRLNPVLFADGDGVRAAGLYLCVSSDGEKEPPAVQWAHIQQGVNTYVFRDLRPATNYSLCFAYAGQECDVQVVFCTRMTAPSLLVIVSVCVVLLMVSTLPLLGAMCYHLVYKYRGKTYKLILKARDQYQSERNMGGHFHLQAPYQSESRRNINGSELDEGEAERGGGRREREEEEEEEEGSQATESFSMSRANTEDFEAGSEYSDRLPLGAEAFNITSNYRYPSQ